MTASTLSAPSPFLVGTNIRFAWDSTTLMTFQSCPRKYYYLFVEGWISRGFQLDLDFGILYHKGLELWEKQGRDRAALIQAIRYVISSPHAASLRAVEWNHKKSLTHLIRALVWYAEEHAHDNLKTLQLERGPALELSFRIDLGENMLYCGHLDRVVTINDSLYFVDRKTTGKSLSPDYFTQFRLSLQMDGYALGSKIIFDRPAQGGIIEAVQLAVNFCRFERSPLDYPAASLEESLHEIREWINLATTYAEAGFWPRNKQSCFLCLFKNVCSRPEGAREAFLQADFERKPLWNPLIPR